MSAEPAGITPELVRRMEIKPTLKTCERSIERAMVSYAVAGDALRMIRTHRLYRQAGFSSFDTYCRERWGWSQPRASQLEAAAQIYDLIYEQGETNNRGYDLPTPRNERAARELTPLRKQPELLLEAWAKAVEKHGPDAEAKHVRQVVREIAPPPKPKAPPQRPEPAARGLTDAIAAIRRLTDNGYPLSLLREALDHLEGATN